MKKSGTGSLIDSLHIVLEESQTAKTVLEWFNQPEIKIIHPYFFSGPTVPRVGKRKKSCYNAIRKVVDMSDSSIFQQDDATPDWSVT